MFTWTTRRSFSPRLPGAHLCDRARFQGTLHSKFTWTTRRSPSPWLPGVRDQSAYLVISTSDLNKLCSPRLPGAYFCDRSQLPIPSYVHLNYPVVIFTWTTRRSPSLPGVHSHLDYPALTFATGHGSVTVLRHPLFKIHLNYPALMFTLATRRSLQLPGAHLHPDYPAFTFTTRRSRLVSMLSHLSSWSDQVMFTLTTRRLCLVIIQ